jgi:ubiquitin-protein ligase
MNQCCKNYLDIKSNGSHDGIYVAVDQDLFKQYLMIQNKDKLLFFFEVDMPASPMYPPKITHITPFPVPEHPRMPINQLVQHEILNTYGIGWQPILMLLHIALDLQLMTNELESNDVYYQYMLANVSSFTKNTPAVINMFEDDIKKIWNKSPNL